MKTLLTAKATSKGGRAGQSQTQDGKLKFEMNMPGMPAKTGITTTPEELFACGYAACFGGALDYIAKQQKVDAKDATVNAEVSLNQDDNGFFLSVVMDVSVPNLDAAAAQKLVEATHQFCPYSKATKGNIDVTLKVNSMELKKAA